MATYQDLQIKTGFLSGNLFNDVTDIDVDASARAYGRALREDILAAYPEADVLVIWIHAKGTRPYSLRTQVRRGDMTEETDTELEKIAEHVEWIASMLWYGYGRWMVNLPQEASA